VSGEDSAVPRQLVLLISFRSVEEEQRILFIVSWCRPDLSLKAEHKSLEAFRASPRSASMINAYSMEPRQPKQSGIQPAQDTSAMLAPVKPPWNHR
jgi:hypothetical protein